MHPEQSWRTSLTQADVVCGFCGATVALVLQDVTVLLPFVTAVPIGALVLHGLSRIPPELVRWLAATLVVAGLAGVAYGRFISDDGTLQALGVLGGSALAAAGVVLFAITQDAVRISR